MVTSAKSLGIDRLSVENRLRLVEEIWDGIAASVESMGIPQSHKDELDRRRAAMEADSTAGSSWDVVKARLKETPGNAR
ncbi:MAG: addiction module protein [Isosphaeraceae bacterium]